MDHSRPDCQLRLPPIPLHPHGREAGAEQEKGGGFGDGNGPETCANGSPTQTVAFFAACCTAYRPTASLLCFLKRIQRECKESKTEQDHVGFR